MLGGRRSPSATGDTGVRETRRLFMFSGRNPMEPNFVTREERRKLLREVKLGL